MFTFFWKNDKTTVYSKIFKILFRKFSPRSPIDVLSTNLVKFVKFGQREMGKILRDLPDQKIRLPLQLSLLRGWRPKSARASPQQFTQSATDFIQIGSLSAHL